MFICVQVNEYKHARRRRTYTTNGHMVKSVKFVRGDQPGPCPGVVCKCHELGRFCSAHGITTATEN